VRYHQKPVRKCHGCGLNLGDHCWLYAYPRGQWRGERCCRAYGDAALYAALGEWRKRPDVKTRKTLRRETRRQRSESSGGEGAAWLRERGLL